MSVDKKKSYASGLKRSGEWHRQEVVAGQEIGPPPDVKNMPRRIRTTGSLERFLKLYFPWAFYLRWSPDHIRVIDKMERAILEGGLFALAMPRGSGKTTISERAALWAILTGRRKFVTLVGATERHAEQILKSQMTELQYNDFLMDDYPEACHAIRKLENEARRCKGQKCEGEPTNIVWTAAKLVFPTLPARFKSLSSGSIISVCGVTGAIRGQKHTTVSGEILRPSFILIDDPQTRESAESETQCVKLENIIAGDVLGMAGPGQSISAVMPCTVIRRGDMADRLLNRKTHPDWSGERTKMLTSLPADKDAIDKYAEMRAELLLEERPLSAANTYWRKNREALEGGASASWPARKKKGEVSAIQHAVNLMIRDRQAFFSEYQNEPIELESDNERLLTADDICRKTNGIDRGQLAVEWNHITAMIDVQKEVLYWIVCGFGDGFSGGVLDYGTFPEQGRNYFTLADLSRSLGDVFGNLSPEAAIYAGLKQLTGDLCARRWRRQDGAELPLERLLIDEGFQTDVIHQFCRQSDHANTVIPCKGWGIKAGNKPLNDYQKKQGDRPGIHCRLARAEGRTTRHLLIDTNHWKSFVFARLAAPMGGAGCLSLFGRAPTAHRLIADHLKAEFCVKTFGRGREVTEWSLKPGKPDNHWFDCLTGATCAASLLGCTLTGQPYKAFAPRKARVPLARMGR